MTDAQIQLQNALTTTFLANLVFLSEYDNELYHRIDELSRMIENGTYQEKYALEFNMQEGDFDIFDIVNNKYLYNKQPKKKSDELVRKVEFNEKNAIFNVEEIFNNKSIFDVNFENRFNFEMLEATAHTCNQMKEYTNITKDYLENKKKKLKKIKKFIFLGTLLGRHIPRLAKKVDADLYLVLERNLEIFRLSLFTVDYTILAEKCVFFSIMDEIYKEEEKIALFLNINKYNNYLLKFSTTGINIDSYISIILGIISSNKPTIYDHNRNLYVHLSRTVQRIKEKYNFPQFEDIQKDFQYFQNTPILYIAAGPSLDENIDWIKQNQNKFVICCIGRTLKKLIDNEIRVDIVTTVDEQEFLSTMQFDDETIKKLPKHTILLASALTHKNVLNKFNKNRVFIFEVFKKIFLNNIAFHGYSVGEVTLCILLSLNPKDIYLVGLDLALNQETGESHSKDSRTSLKTFDINQEDDRSSFGLNDSLLKVKGNFKQEVTTTALFYISINFINQQILKDKPNGINIYNLSQNGTYFESTIPTKIDEININSFKQFDINDLQIEENLKAFSKNTLGKNEILVLNSDIKYIEDFINNYLKNIREKEFKNFEDFYENCLQEIFTKLDIVKFRILNLILEQYYLLLIPYLNYHFDDTKIKDEAKKVNKIKEIFIYQIKAILEDYLKLFKQLNPNNIL